MKALRINNKYRLLISITTLTIILDQFLKILVDFWVPAYSSITVVPGLLNLTHIYNSGVAFGFLADKVSNTRHIFIITTSLIAMGTIIYFYIKTPNGYALLLTGLSMILGGAIGNIIDRFRLGNVVDYIDICIMNIHWPAFNFADSVITIGILILIHQLIYKKVPNLFYKPAK